MIGLKPIVLHIQRMIPFWGLKSPADHGYPPTPALKRGAIIEWALKRPIIDRKCSWNGNASIGGDVIVLLKSSIIHIPIKLRVVIVSPQYFAAAVYVSSHYRAAKFPRLMSGPIAGPQ